MRNTDIRLVDEQTLFTRIGWPEDKTNPNFIGCFGHKIKGNQHHYSILKLDEFDENYYKDVVLKEHEFVYRYQTPQTLIGKIRPIIKISYKYNMVYFLTENGFNNDIPEFESRGCKFSFLTILDTEYNNNQ